MGRKRSKYSRRSASTVHRGKVVLAIVGAVLAVLLSALLAVLCGNLLGARIDKLEEGKDEEITPIETVESVELDREIPNASAHDFEYSSKISGYTQEGIYDLSICLRDIDGYVPYASAVAGAYDADKVGSADLKTKVGDMHEYSARAFGYFYSSCFAESDENIRRIKKAYEMSLISEAAHAGVDDVLLLGISVNAGNISEVLEFVREIKSEVGKNVRVGIATDCSTLLSTHSDVYIAGKLLRGCDFLALDIRDFVYTETTEGVTSRPQYDPSTGGVEAANISELLSLMKYYIKSYSLRVIFDADDQAGLEIYTENGFDSYQTVRRKYSNGTM